MFRASVVGLLALLAATRFGAGPDPAPTPATTGITILDERAEMSAALKSAADVLAAKLS